MTKTRKVGKQKNVALIAHDTRKTDMIEWVRFNLDTLKRHRIWATGTTGRLIEEELGIPINKLKSGPMGGDQQIGAMIANGELDLIIFMIDGLQAMPHSSDINALTRIASVYNVPIACNRSTADFIISSPLFRKEYEIKLPDYSAYVDRFSKQN